ncbi:MAG: DUF411 domain-containing protein [Burkholderiaceae bacterium]|nr:DUF411 domain-containing protein [Burkholderiaceae bacterium]
MQRRTLIHHTLQALAAASAVALAPPLFAQGPKPLVEVWKDPNCGCCKDWVMHLEASGFAVKTHDSGNDAKRASVGLARQHASCHTAVVNGYVLEGHVPASDIKRLLQERPKALGLAVPGMPVGSPGMDGPAYGGRKDPFDVLLVQADGSHRVFKSYDGKVRS